jgi:uncharacterized membrane protein YhaH (DUF805 family)
MGYFDALLRYFEFWGRTSRAQYWTYQLLMLAAIAAAVLADVGAIRTGFEQEHIGLIVAFVTIFHYVPTITTTVRRLHDIGKSGWWYLLCFVPLGGFVVLFWMFRRGDTGDNGYGPPPSADFDGGEDAGYVPPAGRLVRMGSNAPRPAVAFDPQAISTNRFI